MSWISIPSTNAVNKNYSRDFLTPVRAWLLPTRRGMAQKIAGSAAPRPVLDYVETDITD